MAIDLNILYSPNKILPHLIPLAKHNSAIHGVAHWTRVHRYGLLLAATLGLSESEKVTIALFAWTHDLARTDDGGGNQHAIDGAKYVEVLTSTLFTNFPEDTLDIVRHAIRYHSDGMNAEEALYELPIEQYSTWTRETILNTLGCCWDADRLDLLRLGIVPHEAKMSTPYWHEVLPLAAKLNKQMALIEDNETSNMEDWFAK